MEPEACYAGTLQLKQLAEYHLAQCRTAPDQADQWSATVAYFEDQLQRRCCKKARLNLHGLSGLIHFAFDPMSLRMTDRLISWLIDFPKNHYSNTAINMNLPYGLLSLTRRNH